MEISLKYLYYLNMYKCLYYIGLQLQTNISKKKKHLNLNLKLYFICFIFYECKIYIFYYLHI